MRIRITVVKWAISWAISLATLATGFADQTYTGQTVFTNPTGTEVVVKNDDGDSTVTFFDPNDTWYSMGIDYSDARKFKLNYGGYPGENTTFVLDNAGKVGFGTNAPLSQFHVHTGNLVPLANAPTDQTIIFSAIRGGGNDPAFYNDSGAGIQLLLKHDVGSDRGAFVKSVSEASYSRNVALEFGTSYNYEEPVGRMYLTGEGNLGIGTTTPVNKLDVNGTIRAKEVIVESNWADYVFEDDYQLLPLSEVGEHIHTHRRLPGLPSASEVSESGISLGDSQRMLLEKIEELTLYVIEKDKQVASLQQRVREKDELLSLILNRIEALEAK